MERKMLLKKLVSDDCLVKYYLRKDKSDIDGENLFGVEIEFVVHGDDLKTYSVISKLTRSEKLILKIIAKG